MKRFLQNIKEEFNYLLFILVAIICATTLYSSQDLHAQNSNQIINSFSNHMVAQIQNRTLVVDYDGDTVFEPYFVKGVGYAPVPIGQFQGSGDSWSTACLYTGPYPLNNPDNRFDHDSPDGAYDCGSYGDNFYQSLNNLDRDFSLLKEMNANTIRTWGHVTPELLFSANKYGLKVIAGYWVNHDVDYTFSGAEGSSQRQALIDDFVNYVNNNKLNSAILAWGISNENNLNFCNECFNIPNCDREAQAAGYYNLVNDMSLAAKAAEGYLAHPSIVVSAELTDDLINYGHLMSDVDIIGINSYRGQNFDGFPSTELNLFDKFESNFFNKALLITEFGTDAWNVNGFDANPENGFEDQVGQSAYVTSAWDDIVLNSVGNGGPVNGGVVFHYSDNWNGFAVPDPDNACYVSSDWTPSVRTHDHEFIDPNVFGLGVAPDNRVNGEWWGIMSVGIGGTDPFTPDIMTPRQVYFELQNRFAETNSVALAILDIDANGVAHADTDGALVVRYLFGIRGASLIDGVVAGDCTRCTASEIEAYLNTHQTKFDVDLSGSAAALQDGQVIIRYLNGVRGASLINGVVDPNGQRTTVQEIENYLLTLVSTVSPSSICGNSTLELNEECDDGNTTNGDGCSSECLIEGSCGDGICQLNEGHAQCPVDCPSFNCGDGFCSAFDQENGVTCQPDCSITCGDQICQQDEGYQVCEQDCPSFNCGDGFCSAFDQENGVTCQPDCSVTCGDQICQQDEGYQVCEQDCPSFNCGDGFCSAFDQENGVTCQPDCSVTCGDQICQQDEGYQVCEQDCPSFNCGDGFCSALDGETVVTCSPDCGPVLPEITSHIPGSVLNGSSVTFNWRANGTNVLGWWLYVGNASNNKAYYDSGSLDLSLSDTATGIPSDGSQVKVTLWYRDSSAWKFEEFFYTADTATVELPTITSPLPNTILDDSSVTFNWRANGTNVLDWWLYVGNASNNKAYYDSGSLGLNLSDTATGIPVDGSQVKVTLWYRDSSGWKTVESFYTAKTATVELPAITSPLPNTILDDSSVTFNWSANETNVLEWWLYVGNDSNNKAYYDSGSLGLNLSDTGTGILTDGSQVKVTLWYRDSSGWKFDEFFYTADTATGQ